MKTTVSERKITSASTLEKSPVAPVSRFKDTNFAAVRECIERGEYHKAYKMLPAESSDDETRNIRGVCLLRMHQFDTAIQVFRSLVLDRGGVWSRTDLPGYVKVNFALALFFGGYPSGATDVLTEVHRSVEPSAQKFQTYLEKWMSEMNFFQRLVWKAANVVPSVKPKPPAEDIGTFSWEHADLAA